VLERHGGNITYEAISEMEYLDEVVSEFSYKRKIVSEQVITLAMCHSLLTSDVAGGEWFSLNDHTQQ
jgi:hypothetical protein